MGGDLGRFFVLNMFPPNLGFPHTQTTHPNNMIYLSPEDEWKHWLYAVILTFKFSGFRVVIPNSESVGFQSLGPGTGDMKMHAPKNRNWKLAETFRWGVAKLG